MQKVFKRESPDSENLSAKSFVFLMLPQCLELNFKNGIFLERTFWSFLDELPGSPPAWRMQGDTALEGGQLWRG